MMMMILKRKKEKEKTKQNNVQTICLKLIHERVYP